MVDQPAKSNISVSSSAATNGHRMRLRAYEGSIWYSEEAFGYQSQRSATPCLVLHNVCEMHGESMSEDKVERALQYDRHFQPSAMPARDSNNTEEKRVRCILARYLDP